MKLGDVFEEIAERLPSYSSERSILRKINFVRSNLYRNYKKELIVSTLDLNAGEAQYPLPCPFSAIKEVVVNGKTYRHQASGDKQYYYIMQKSIGIYPTPDQTVEEGLQIFHYDIPDDLSMNDWDAEPVFDENYDMLVVYGVLIEMDKGERYNEFKTKYEELLKDFIRANADPLPEYIPVV